MSLVLGRNRRTRETRKLLVPLSLHLVIGKAKKRSKFYSVSTTFPLHEVPKSHSQEGSFQAQVTIALIKPTLLNALRTTSVSSSPGLTQPPPPCALGRLCCCTQLWPCL